MTTFTIDGPRKKPGPFGLSRLAVAAVLVIGSAAWAANMFNVVAYFKGGAYIGEASYVTTTGNKITRTLGGSATIDFSSASDNVALSSSITVTGAAAGDPCFVGVPTAAAALKAQFGCYVDAADSVKVWFRPAARDVGTCTLDGASPSVCTGTVTASTVCTCSPVGATAAIAAGGCAVGVSSTTLTVTAANGASHVVNYDCKAPVDPASGTYYVRVISSQ